MANVRSTIISIQFGATV